MRNSTNFDSQSFVYQCEETLKKYSDIFFRTSASDSPKWLDVNFENTITLKTRKLDDLIVLSMLSYYIPEEIGILLRFELQEVANRNPEVEILHFLLQGKGLMYCFLCDTKLWSTRDFFGNILTSKRLKQSRNLFSLKFKSKKRPKRTLRHRGYRDKGSLRKNHEYHSFVSFTKEMNEIEELRRVRKDTLAFLQGYLE